MKYDHNIYVRLRGLTKSFVDSVWKPLCGPVCDWPLAVCDTQTVDASQDLTNHDVVLGTKTRENVMVFHNPAQRWYYLKGQMPWELWVFRQADSEGHQGMFSSRSANEYQIKELIPIDRCPTCCFQS